MAFSPSVTKGFEVAKTVSGKAVQVTEFVAGTVSLATSALGRYLAPHIQQQGTRLLTNTFKMDETAAKNKMDNTFKAAAAAVEAYGTVYGALKQSAGILENSLARNTVLVVQRKYGDEAGHVTENIFDTVEHVVAAARTMEELNPKGLAESAVKASGKAIVEDQRKHLLQDTDASILRNQE